LNVAEFAIPPRDAVRVWRGFRSEDLPLHAFLDRLSTVFIPATVLMQIQAGLCSYIPCVLGGLPDKPAVAPDETALLYWESQQTYLDGFKTLAVRTYTLTHGAVYTGSSGAAFPIPFQVPLQQDVPSCLGGRIDWMHASIRHLVGARKVDVASSDFAGSVADACSGSSPEAAIVVVGADYLAYWEAGVAAGHDERFERLSASCSWTHDRTAAAIEMTVGLWADWAGLAVAPGDLLNLQFRRRSEQEPHSLPSGAE
jgi:hypothetical protein